MDVYAFLLCRIISDNILIRVGVIMDEQLLLQKVNKQSLSQSRGGEGELGNLCLTNTRVTLP